MVMEAGGHKVVVADSDRTVLELLQIRLDVAGYHACVARTGVDLLDMLKYMRPAALVLDKGLAEMDGFEVLQAIGKRAEKPPPTLIIGKQLGIEDIKLARSLGATDFMIKPFSGADVIERVSRMLRATTTQPQKKVMFLNT